MSGKPTFPTLTMLTVRDFAVRLSVSPWTVRSWIDSGKLASVKVGRGRRCTLRIPSTEFDRIVIETLRPAIKPFLSKRKAS
jgi:excisionase family DNA binding protein